MRKYVLLPIALALATGVALAQPGATQDFMKAMQDMHQAMMKADDRDADRAFALKMIEHHRGGIAMSAVLLKHGDDAELKSMAQKTSDMQKKEIAELQAWLGRHGGQGRR